MDYTRQTRFSDPRQHAALFDPLPADPAGIGEVVRNLAVHYRASGIEFPPDRLAEIDSRWVDRMLDVDQRRHATPLAEPRPPEERVVGCCRDFTLLTVAALRHKGVPARSRIGFADYLDPSFHHDHVIAEYWDGARWIATDSQFDMPDVRLTTGGLRTAAQVWSAYRRGEIDVETFGVGGDLPFRGNWFVRNYVIYEVAHRLGDELLLWDVWGDVSLGLGDDLALIDEVADLLQSADAGDRSAERKLAERYAGDPRLQPGGEILCASPRTGEPFPVSLLRST
ncbi:transglutaminase domain-containing protein [Actinoplanes sp. NPDC026619]|uniref:transglutaminase domain-containing protein n=1 Tax=Actinoplanes sp. NPDC026619 TaxID=3155798 RepID=UPI0033FCF358